MPVEKNLVSHSQLAAIGRWMRRLGVGDELPSPKYGVPNTQ